MLRELGRFQKFVPLVFIVFLCHLLEWGEGKFSEDGASVAGDTKKATNQFSISWKMELLGLYVGGRGCGIRSRGREIRKDSRSWCTSWRIGREVS